jgi:hypothetical protein
VRMADVIALAALAVTALLIRLAVDTGPIAVTSETSRHRETAITTTVAPRIAGPIGRATTADSLRWTSVPHADRYQVLVFDREGTLIWQPHTGDTILPVPARLRRVGATTYIWKVEARTGWDRWVASEWEQFTIGPADPAR